MNAVLPGQPGLASEFEYKSNQQGNDPTLLLIEAASRDDVPGMRYARLKGANKWGSNEDGDNIFTVAAKNNALSAIDYAATELGGWVDTASRQGKTGLLIAIEERLPRAAAKFLAYGANPLTVGKSAHYRVKHCFAALEEALEKENAVQDGVVNEIWSPVVAGMIHRLFNPEFWPDDKNAVWDGHIPVSIQNLRLHSGVSIRQMHEDRQAAVEAAKLARSNPSTLDI